MQDDPEEIVDYFGSTTPVNGLEKLLDGYGVEMKKDALLDLRPPDGKLFGVRELRRGQSKYVERLRAIIATNGAGVPDW